MTAQDFCQKWFPLVVTCGGNKYPLEWFHTRGVARIAGEFVVTVYPWGSRLPGKPDPTLRDDLASMVPSVASTWTGLAVDVVEHGVGRIDMNTFPFEMYLTSRRDGMKYLSEHYQGMVVIDRDGYPKQALTQPPYFWHCYEPTNLDELLKPMQSYIAHWL